MDGNATIELCMGSACYLRGNRENAELLKEYLEQNKNQATLVLRGTLCRNECRLGPRVVINGTVYHDLNGPAIIEMLCRHVGEAQ